MLSQIREHKHLVAPNLTRHLWSQEPGSSEYLRANSENLLGLARICFSKSTNKPFALSSERIGDGFNKI